MASVQLKQVKTNCWQPPRASNRNRPTIGTLLWKKKKKTITKTVLSKQTNKNQFLATISVARAGVGGCTVTRGSLQKIFLHRKYTIGKGW